MFLRRCGFSLGVVCAGLYLAQGLGREPRSGMAFAKTGLRVEAAQAGFSEQQVNWGLFLPPGEGQLQTGVYCAGCHNLKNVVCDRRADQSGWQETVERMVFSHEAPLPEEDIEVVSKYLAQHFGPSTPKLELPVRVNNASKEVLALLPGLSEKDAQQILESREKIKIKDVLALEAVLGKDKAAKIKEFLNFSEETEKVR